MITDEKTAPLEFEKFAGKAFIKDYVKSLKTGKGSIVDSQTDLLRALSEMKFYRGIIEGGVVLREVVNIQPNSEVRFFVARNKMFTPTVKDCDKYKLVENVVEKLGHKKLNFYSVDVANISNGDIKVIELGDGQVSDYPGWSLNNFITILKWLSSAR